MDQYKEIREQLLAKQKELHQREQELKNTELEKKRIAQEQLQYEIEHLSRQLTTHTLNIIQKNRLLEELRKRVQDLKNANGNLPLKLSQINRFIDYSLDIDQDWEQFRLYFEQVNQNFYKKLKSQFPDLSPAELRLAALIKLNMRIKEAAAVLNISPGSVKTARYRLRKKLSLNEEKDLNDFLTTY